MSVSTDSMLMNKGLDLTGTNMEESNYKVALLQNVD